MTVTEGDTIEINDEEGQWTVIDTDVKFDTVKERFESDDSIDHLRRSLGQPIGKDMDGQPLYPSEPLILCEQNDQWLLIPQCECR